MADRSVVIRLIANVGSYVAGMTRAGAATAAVGRQAQVGMAQASTAFTRAGGNVDKLAKGAAIGGAALAVGLGAAVKASADFDDRMAKVRANVDLNGVSFDKLTAAVKTQGTQFGFTAMESADAADDLAKAGLNASQIIGGGLVGSLTLAAAGNISAGDAAETAATAMTMFGLSAKDIPHIADLLAAGADKSTASVGSLSEGLMEGGSLAHLMGVSIEDTTAVLAEFDQSGLKGAKAGNALKTMFQNLLDPTKKQQETMDQLGLSFFDANGKFIGLSATAGQLQDKLGGLTDQQRNAALSILFGARSIQAANILYKDGAAGVKSWEHNVNASGFAAENARKKMDSLKGDLNKLKSAVIELAINGGAAATTFLRPLASGATHLLSGISALPAPILTVGTGLLTLSAGGLLAAAAAIKITSAVRGTIVQLGAARAAVVTYTGAQVAARGAAISLAETEAIRNGVILASARAFNAEGAALMTLATGQRIALGTVGTSVALMGRTAIPTLGAVQVAYYGASGAAAKFAATSKAALVGFGKFAGITAVAAALAYGLKELNDYVARSQVADVQTKKLAASMSSLSSGTATGGLADLFRESGSSISLWGHQLGAGREQVVSTSDVVSRFKDDLDTLNLSGFKKGLNYIGLWGGNSSAASKQVKQLDDALVQMIKSGNSAGAKKAFDQLTKGMNPEQIAEAKKALSGYTSAIGHVADKAKPAESATKSTADAIAAMGKKSKDSQEDVEALTNAIKGLGDAQLGARGSARSYQAAIDDATDSLKKNGQTLDITTAKGRDNQEKLDGIASATTDWASSQYKLTNSMSQANAILDTGKKQYVDMAVNMGMNRQQAKLLADQLFRMPASVDTSVSIDGGDEAIYKVDKLGNLVVSVSGRKIVIPASAPNAEQTAKVLYSVKDAATNAAGTAVKIPASVIHSHETLDALLGIKGARLNADGSVAIPTSALNAKQTTDLLSHLGRVAVDADGKSVIIPASTPNAPAVISLIKQIHGAQVSANGKKVVITSSAPLAADTKAKIDRIRGAQVSADGRHVTINSSVPNYGTVLSEIQSLLSAAHDKSFTITANYVNHVTNTVENIGKSILGHADGALYGTNGVRRMAQGGIKHQAAISTQPILWGEAGPELYAPLTHDSRAARAKKLISAGADFYGYDMVKRAQGSITGVRSDWARATPVQTAPTVIFQGATNAQGQQPIRIEINGVRTDNANDVAKELVYSMARNGIGKWAGA